MKFIIVRHGQAELHNEDDSRGLTDIGKEEANSVGRFLKSLNTCPQYIIHSGKKRSYDTALRISDILDTSDRLHYEKNAGPDGSVIEILDFLANFQSCIILVSHIPLVNNISDFLLFPQGSGNVLRFDTGTVLILKRNRSTDSILHGWSITTFLKPINFGF